jgi:hypothetical protein
VSIDLNLEPAPSFHGSAAEAMANEEFSFDLGNVPDKILLSSGVYTFNVVKADVKEKEETGNRWISLVLSCKEEPIAETVFYSLFLPTPADDDKKRIFKLRQLKAFRTACGMNPADNFKASDLVGAEFRAQVAQEVPKNRTEPENVIKKVVV